MQDSAGKIERVYCVLYGTEDDRGPKRLACHPDEEAFKSKVGPYKGLYGETMKTVEKGGMDKHLGFTVTEVMEDGAQRKKLFLARSKSERDKWSSDLNAMAADVQKAIERSHQGRLSQQPIQNAEPESYTEGNKQKTKQRYIVAACSK